jgi:hypothetical protein
VEVVQGDKTPEEAACAIVKETGKGALVSYTTAFAGSTIKSLMQNAESKVLQGLAKTTNLPGMIVTATLEIGKTLARYCKGEIDGLTCLEELGEKGSGMAASAVFSVLGQIALPVPVIGDLLGGMLGYALNSAFYGQLVSSLKSAKLAEQERIRIEAECKKTIRMIQEYRVAMETHIDMYLSDHIHIFQTAFDGIKTALRLGDIDGFITGANSITEKLSGKVQFRTFTEFDAFMQSSETFIL